MSLFKARHREVTGKVTNWDYTSQHETFTPRFKTTSHMINNVSQVNPMTGGDPYKSLRSTPRVEPTGFQATTRSGPYTVGNRKHMGRRDDRNFDPITHRPMTADASTIHEKSSNTIERPHTSSKKLFAGRKTTMGEILTSNAKSNNISNTQGKRRGSIALQMSLGSDIFFTEARKNGKIDNSTYISEEAHRQATKRLDSGDMSSVLHSENAKVPFVPPQFMHPEKIASSIELQADINVVIKENQEKRCLTGHGQRMFRESPDHHNAIPLHSDIPVTDTRQIELNPKRNPKLPLKHLKKGDGVYSYHRMRSVDVGYPVSTPDRDARNPRQVAAAALRYIPVTGICPVDHSPNVVVSHQSDDPHIQLMKKGSLSGSGAIIGPAIRPVHKKSTITSNDGKTSLMEANVAARKNKEKSSAGQKDILVHHEIGPKFMKNSFGFSGNEEADNDAAKNRKKSQMGEYSLDYGYKSIAKNKRGMKHKRNVSLASNVVFNFQKPVIGPSPRPLREGY